MATQHSLNPSSPEDRPPVYQIRIAGRLSPRWQAHFDGMTISPGEDGDTIVSGPVVDQAALHGMLRSVRDLGLTLISVSGVEPRPASDEDSGQRGGFSAETEGDE